MGGIGRWKITEVEERIFNGDEMKRKWHEMKIKEHLTMCKKLRILYIEDRVVVDYVV